MPTPTMTIRLRTPTPPEHVENTVSAISQAHAEHYRRVRPAQRTAAVAIAALGRPAFVGVLSVAVSGWIMWRPKRW